MKFYMFEETFWKKHAKAFSGIHDIMEKNAFQGSSAFFMADVLDGHDAETFPADVKRGGPHQHFNGLKRAPSQDPAFPDIRLVVQGREHGSDPAVLRTKLRGATAAGISAGVCTV